MAFNPFWSSSSSSSSAHTQGISKEEKLTTSEGEFEQLLQKLDSLCKETDITSGTEDSGFATQPLPKAQSQATSPPVQENIKPESIGDVSTYIESATIADEVDVEFFIKQAIIFCSKITDLAAQQGQIKKLHSSILELAHKGHDVSRYMPAYLGWINAR
jgi:hypothetical protein